MQPAPEPFTRTVKDSMPNLINPLRPDNIDRIIGLDVNSAVFALRREREKVRLGAEASEEALLNADLPGSLSRTERLMICIYAASTSNAEPLAVHYRNLWPVTDLDLLASLNAVLAGDDFTRLPTPRSIALLTYARTLLLEPVHGDQSALAELASAGLSEPDIVALSQLVGFLSFQIRLVAGVNAIAEMDNGQ